MTIYGPHPVTWREYLTAVLRSRLNLRSPSRDILYAAQEAFRKDATTL